jgi:hypothetical protein
LCAAFSNNAQIIKSMTKDCTQNLQDKSLHLVFLIAIVVCSSNLFGQNSSQKDKCRLIESFFDSLSKRSDFVLKDFHSDSLLIILDPYNLLEGCPTRQWLGHPLSIANKGPLVDSVQVQDPHFVIKRRCNYFILSKNKSKSLHTLYMLQPCSNEIGTAEVRKRKGHLYILKIQYGVL